MTVKTEICKHCGQTAEDVQYQAEHVGGHRAYRLTGPFCQDRRACWKRWDRQNMEKADVN